jgi:hypothetical protein
MASFRGFWDSVDGVVSAPIFFCFASLSLLLPFPYQRTAVANMHIPQQSAERTAERDEAAANNLKAGEGAGAALPPTLLEWIGSFIVRCFGSSFSVRKGMLMGGFYIIVGREEPGTGGGGCQVDINPSSRDTVGYLKTPTAGRFFIPFRFRIPSISSYPVSLSYRYPSLHAEPFIIFHNLPLFPHCVALRTLLRS